MSETVDTSAEAQHWIGMAPDWAGAPATDGEPGLRAFLLSGATMMKTLLAERDHWHKYARDADAYDEITTMERDAAICERDAARAEAARLRGTLTWVLNDVQAWCDAIAENGAGWDYWDDYYKSFKRGGIEKARAALATKEPGHE